MNLPSLESVLSHPLALALLLSLFLLDFLLLPRLQLLVQTLFGVVDRFAWAPKVAEKHPKLVQWVFLALYLGPLQARLFAVIGCLWFDWRAAAILCSLLPWLHALGLILARKGLELLAPAPAPNSDFQPRIVTAENCAEFGLTPEKVREMTESMTESVRRASQLDAVSDEQIYAEYGVTPEEVLQMTDRLMEKAKRCPEAAEELDPAICAEYGLTPAKVLDLTRRLMELHETDPDQPRG